MKKLKLIAAVVTRETGITLLEMRRRTKETKIVEARQSYVWLCSELIPRSKNQARPYYDISTTKIMAYISRKTCGFHHSKRVMQQRYETKQCLYDLDKMRSLARGIKNIKVLK